MDELAGLDTLETRSVGHFCEHLVPAEEETEDEADKEAISKSFTVPCSVLSEDERRSASKTGSYCTILRYPRNSSLREII